MLNKPVLLSGRNGAFVAPNLHFASDGGSFVWSHPDINPPHVYNAATNTTWFHTEASDVFGNRVVKVTTYNHTTKVWSREYVVGTRTLGADLHGVPSCVIDATGRDYCFYGGHQSAVNIAVSAPNDPSSYNDTQTYGNGTTAMVTFPKPYLDAATGNIDLFFNTKAPGGGAQGQISVQPFSVSSGTLTPTGGQAIVDFSGFWAPPGTFQQVGSKVYMTWTYGPTSEATKQDVFFAIFDQVTRSLSNIDGSTTVVAGSQPISLTTARANFRVVDQVDITHYGCQPAMIYDGSTVHILYCDQPNLGTPNGGLTLLHTFWNGSSWAATHTIFTYGTGVNGFNPNFGAIVNPDGGIDVYFPDGTFAPPLEIGNIQKATRTSGGSWSSPSVFLAATTYGLNCATPIFNGHPDAALAFTENSVDELTIVGNLKSYAVGKSGAYLTKPVLSPSQAFLARTSGLDTRHTYAYTALIKSLIDAGVWSSLKVLYCTAAQNSTVALLNLVNESFPLLPVNSPTFTADAGYAGNGTSSYLDTQFIAANFTNLDSLTVFAWELTHTNGNGAWGAYDPATSRGQLVTPTSTTNLNIRFNRAASGDLNLTIATDIGFFGAVRTSSSNVDAYSNATQLLGNSQASVAAPNASMKIGAIAATAGGYDTAQVGMFCVADALTPAQMAAVYKACHAYMQLVAGVA